jgi:hypothetical protein
MNTRNNNRGSDAARGAASLRWNELVMSSSSHRLNPAARWRRTGNALVDAATVTAP